jgi:hypothetical protein
MLEMMTVKITVFCDVAPYNLINRQKRSGGIFYLRLQGGTVGQAWKKKVGK